MPFKVLGALGCFGVFEAVAVASEAVVLTSAIGVQKFLLVGTVKPCAKSITCVVTYVIEALDQHHNNSIDLYWHLWISIRQNY
jgi:hypothetical protein